jgi:hypothetical protein
VVCTLPQVCGEGVGCRGISDGVKPAADKPAADKPTADKP